MNTRFFFLSFSPFIYGYRVSEQENVVYPEKRLRET